MIFPPRMSDDDVGAYYIDEAGVAWRLVGYCRHPTATLENVATGERRGGAVGAPIFNGLRRLVAEDAALTDPRP